MDNCEKSCTFAEIFERKYFLMMNMKKTILIIGLALLAITASAADMMHLLQGGYDAKVLTGDEAKRQWGDTDSNTKTNTNSFVTPS